MINWLKQVVFWLEVRFPAKVVLTEAMYYSLGEKVAELEARIVTAATLEVRLAKVEASAVHKEPVQELIKEVIQLKEDVTAIKVNLGWGKPAGNDELTAMLNGERI